MDYEHVRLGRLDWQAFYDLDADIGETTGVVTDHPDVAEYDLPDRG